MSRHPIAHLFAALPESQAGAGAPPWVHLVPAGTFKGVDGRGPFHLASPQAVITASMTAGKLPIDENHAIDLAAPQGRPSPARGWIVAMEARQDGLWGQVDWTPTGKQLFADSSYRGISPAFTTEREDGGAVVRLLRASLTNNPNLNKLATLHQQEPDSMDLLAELRKVLGLADDADAAAVIAAVKDWKEKKPADKAPEMAALQAQVKQIAKAAGMPETADAAVVLNAVTTLAAGAKDGGAIVALQGELVTVTAQLNTLRTDRSKEMAMAFVDGEIAKGRVGVKPMRDHYIAMHALDSARVEKEIGALPVLGASGALTTPPSKDGKPGLTAEQAQTVKLMGVDPKAYAETLAAEAAAAEEVI